MLLFSFNGRYTLFRLHTLNLSAFGKDYSACASLKRQSLYLFEESREEEIQVVEKACLCYFSRTEKMSRKSTLKENEND